MPEQRKTRRAAAIPIAGPGPQAQLTRTDDGPWTMDDGHKALHYDDGHEALHYGTGASCATMPKICMYYPEMPVFPETIIAG